MTSISHPFLHHPETIDIPEDKQKIVKELFKWIQTQPRFPDFTLNHAHLFLHACYWNMEDAKHAMHKYCHIRLTAPEIFDNRDMKRNEVQFVFDMTQMVGMPKQTPEGYNILIYRLSNTDPSKMHFGDALKAFCMFNDVRLSEDGISEGYIVVFDMKGLRLGHLARVQFGPLKAYMNYIQEAHPVRLKKIYVIHATSFISQIMSIIKPLIKSELLSLLQFTTGGAEDILPVELLPQDYGGPLDTIENLYKIQRTQIETEYRDWLVDSEKLREKPKEKKMSKCETPSPLAAPTDNFRTLSID